jgi:hypothetical protein
VTNFHDDIQQSWPVSDPTIRWSISIRRWRPNNDSRFARTNAHISQRHTEKQAAATSSIDHAWSSMTIDIDVWRQIKHARTTLWLRRWDVMDRSGLIHVEACDGSPQADKRVVGVALGTAAAAAAAAAIGPCSRTQ